jgi:hypothetical protein
MRLRYLDRSIFIDADRSSQPKEISLSDADCANMQVRPPELPRIRPSEVCELLAPVKDTPSPPSPSTRDVDRKPKPLEPLPVPRLVPKPVPSASEPKQDSPEMKVEEKPADLTPKSLSAALFGFEPTEGFWMTAFWIFLLSIVCSRVVARILGWC